MKPFMREQSAEFCAACHKVHLDVPVNNYRWVRGFNDYDNWQASGVSGQGARSFYYPPKTSVVRGLPYAAGRVEGSGQPRRQSAFASLSRRQYGGGARQSGRRAVEAPPKQFLKSGFITVDIFAVSPADDSAGSDRDEAAHRNGAGHVHVRGGRRGRAERPGGDSRSRQGVGPGRRRGHVALNPGSTARVDVVVRTRKIGHFFPGGTVDAFDVWLELQAKDADGRVIFWSGSVDRGRQGSGGAGRAFLPLLPAGWRGQSDQQAQCLAGAQRAVCAADSAGRGRCGALPRAGSARCQGPDPVHREAELPQVLAGTTRSSPMPASPSRGRIRRCSTRDHNGLEYEFIATDSGECLRPDPRPHSRSADHDAGAKPRRPCRSARPTWTPVVRKQDRERWNDWGIGLLLQGDLKGAEYAFRKATEAEPEYADGWLNVARALIQEGETEAAKPFIAKALAINPELGPHLVFQGGDSEGRRRLRWRAAIARARRARSIRAIAWCSTRSAASCF